MGLGGIKVAESVIYVMFYYFMVDMSIKKGFTKFYENPFTIGVTVPRTEMTWTPKRYNDMKTDWHENLNTND